MTKQFEFDVGLAAKISADENNNAAAVVLARALLAVEPIVRAADQEESEWPTTAPHGCPTCVAVRAWREDQA